MPGDPLFSVVVPTNNRPAFLAEAIQSVREQTLDQWEIVVVDNGCDPPTQVPPDARIQLVRIPDNRGAAAARNIGIDHARGRYLTFLDDDDLFTPDRLALAVDGLARAPVAICWSRFLDRPPGSIRVLDGDVGDRILDGLTPSLGATAVRRDLVLRFDQQWDAVEDIDWWRRMAMSQPVATIPRIGHLIRRHDGVRFRNGAEARVVENIAYLDAYGDYFTSHPRAAGFRWRRIGLLALRTGDRRLARRAFMRSLRLAPHPATVKHLAEALGPSRRDRAPVPVHAS